MSRLLNLEQLVLPSVLLKRIFYPLHNRKHLLLLEPLADDLDANRQTLHLHGVVVSVRALRDAVERLEIERGRERIEDTVNMGDGKDSTGIVELRGAVNQQPET